MYRKHSAHRTKVGNPIISSKCFFSVPLSFGITILNEYDIGAPAANNWNKNVYYDLIPKAKLTKYQKFIIGIGHSNVFLRIF